MRTLSPWKCVLGMAVILAGCGTLTPPSEYTDLKKRLSTSAATDSAYDEARQQLQAAEDALAQSDAETAKRLSVLGLIEAQIAETQLRQIKLSEATERELQEQQVLEKNVAMWQSRVTQLLAEQSREAMRSHIEAVIEKETLAAAATEELQVSAEGTLGDSLLSARRKVASELIGMAKVRTHLASLLLSGKSILPEQLNGLKGAVALMETALADDDIASVYRYGEESLSQYTKVVDEAWAASGQTRRNPTEALIQGLAQKGFSATREDVGPVVGLTFPPGAASRNLTSAVKSSLDRIADFLRDNPSVAMLAVVSPGIKNREQQKNATQCCGTLREELTRLKIRDTQYSILQLSHERPLRTMTGRGMQVALVFVPIP